jgi:protein-disulfide isomerase
MKATTGLVIAVFIFLGALPLRAQEVPWDQVPNIDAAALSADVRDRAAAAMKEHMCYHECSRTVFQCVTQASPSPTALRLAGFIARQVVRGKPAKEISRELLERAKSVHPFKTVDITLDSAMCLGQSTAPVKVVAFSDFECPFCKLVSPVLRKLAGEFGGKVVYCFKFYPTKGHGKLGVETSKMGVAAEAQGKFWDFHDIMYANFDKHEEEHVKDYADKVGLDWAAFVAAKDSPATRKLVVESKREGLKLGVKSTPTIFVNGKRYHAEKSDIELRDRVEEELDLLK